MSNTIKFSIQVLDEYTRIPIENAKLQLQNVNLGQESITNTQGLAIFEIDSKENLKPFRAKLIHEDYQEYPVLDRSVILNSIKRREKPLELRFKKKLDNFAVQQVKLEPNEYTLTDTNNEIITKNFYKVGDTLTFEASFDENKVKENEIQWAYKVMNFDEIQILQRQDSKDKNPQSTQTHYFQLDEIPNDTLQILQDSKTSFSKISAHTIKNNKPDEAEPENIYKGKTLEIILPQDFENKQIAIFAYKNEPNWKASQIIRLNNYPQITIDCTLAETLRANAKNDEISRLGFGVSYICQRLWHDNPANAKELGELIYVDSKSQDFIDSIPNATMQTIVKDILPRVEMKEFGRDTASQCPKIKSQIQENDKKNLRFYIELDWDEFYLKFPLMKSLEDKILKVSTFGNDVNQFVKDSIKEMTYEAFEYVRKTTETPKILHNNFFDSTFYNLIMEWLNSQSIQKDLENILNNKNSNVKLVVKLHNIYQGFIKNEKIFSLKSNDWISENPCEKQSLIEIKSPYKLWGQCMRAYGLGDTAFASFFDFKEAIALYALTGKFNIYYIPSLFKITQGKNNSIDIQITEIKAYIFDGFDFIGTPEQFVGAWNYENVEFREYYSVAKNFVDNNSAVKEMNNNIMRNFDYQNTQNFFNLGCDFRILTATFKDIEVYPLSMPISVRVD